MNTSKRAGFALALRAMDILFVLMVPLAIVLNNVRLMTFDAGLYERGYQRHEVAHTTGMTPGELAQATAEIQAYFRGGPRVSLLIDKEWGREPLFNAREQQHLADVRALMDLAWRAQEIAVGVLLAVGVALIIARGWVGARRVAVLAAAGAGLTLAPFTALGALALFDFRALWTQFHLLSFTNELWLLDPRTDYMIRLYPLGFWFDAVLEFVLRSVATAVVVFAVAFASSRWVLSARGSRQPRAPRATATTDAPGGS